MRFPIITPQGEGGLPLPGKCKLCGGVDKEFYIDTQAQEEYYGAVIYCNECIHNIATDLGYKSPAQVKEIMDISDGIYLQNVKLFEINKALRGTIDGLVSAGYSEPVTDLHEPPVAVLDPSDSEDSGIGEESVVEGETESDESVSVEGSTDLSGVDGAEQFRLFG